MLEVRNKGEVKDVVQVASWSKYKFFLIFILTNWNPEIRTAQLIKLVD